MESKNINEVQNWDQKGCPDNPKVRILRFECIDQFEIKHVHAPPPQQPSEIVVGQNVGQPGTRSLQIIFNL